MSDWHGDGGVEFTYKLPLEAIEKLFISYYETLKSIREDYVYMHSTGSSEYHEQQYCYVMIKLLMKQLSMHGIDGKKFESDIYNRLFKKDFDDMEKHLKYERARGDI